MAARSELGISPVLLQAIAQTLTSSAASASQPVSRDSSAVGNNSSAGLIKAAVGSTTQSIAQSSSPSYSGSSGPNFLRTAAMNGNTCNVSSVSHLLQDMNEPVASLLPQTSTETVTSVPEAASFQQQQQHQRQQLTQAGLSMLGVSSDQPNISTVSSEAAGGVTLPATTMSSGVTTMSGLQQYQQAAGAAGLSSEEMANFLLKQEPMDEGCTFSAVESGSQPGAMASVSSMLSALASQHAQDLLSKKTTDLNTAGLGQVASSGKDQEQQQQQTILVAHTATATDMPSSLPAAAAATVSPISSLSLPQSSTVTVSTSGGASAAPREGSPQPRFIIYRYVNSEGQEVNLPVAPGSGGQQIVLNADGTLAESVVAKQKIVLQAQKEVANLTNNTSGIVPVTDAQNTADGMSQPCPVCGDKVSGYHYGIFTCESCKGFFKRTVQNKKTFMCPKSSNCPINSMNRKKCPACRFQRCLAMGMKLEAIRQDRTRGGRSSYDGCSHHMKPRVSPLDKKIKRVTGRLPGEPAEGEEEDDGTSSHSNLVAILNHNTHKQTPPTAGVPQIPELLRDIMNLEPLLSDDDLPADTITESPFPEQAVYSYMMQLAELRLYKLVRWARNLPQFGAISTDDQILLLQNCWSELMALSLCWRSIDTPNQISISSSHHITAAWAHHLGFEDVVIQLINITDCFRRLFMDQFEYVALKVLLLITPDVKGLKEPRKIREFQDKLLESLLAYTSSHYSNMKHKFGELLLRLPELSRISFLCKDILIKSLPTSASSCGLLVELLKGDNKGEGGASGGDADQGGLKF